MSKTILITREKDEFARILAANNFAVINLPVIKTKPLADLSDFKNKLARVENYDGIFITSRNAARVLADQLSAAQIEFKNKIYVFGQRSYEILHKRKLNLVFDENSSTALEFLAKIPVEDLRGRSFLFVRGTRSLRVVPDFLGEVAATIDEEIVYETIEKKIETDKIRCLCEQFESGQIAATCFFSPSQAESFLKQFGAEILHQTVIATIGKTTAEYFERRNLTVDFVSPQTDTEKFAESLGEYLKINESDARKIGGAS